MEIKNEIQAKIENEYLRLRELNNSKKEHEKSLLYMQLPRVEEIDREISLLAIRSAERVLKENISPEHATAQMKEQAEALRKERRTLMAENGIEEFVPGYNCPKCCDTGYTEGGRCVCYIQKLQSFLKMPGDRNVSDFEYIKEAKFENFNLNYYEKEIDPDLGRSPYDVMKVTLANCLKYCAEFEPGKSGNLLLFGPSGLGKTFMSGCIANKVSQRGYFVMYKSSYKLFQFLEDYKFGKANREEYSAVYNAVYDCDLLIIDDFGTEFITSYTQSVFFDLLNSRLLEGKSTVISTNLQIAKLEDIYQERVMSRLRNEFKALRFVGSDVRALKNN